MTSFDTFQRERYDFDRRDLTKVGWVLDAAIYRVCQLTCSYKNCPCEFESDICDCQCGDRPNVHWNALDLLQAEIDRLKAGHPSRYKPKTRGWFRDWWWP